MNQLDDFVLRGTYRRAGDPETIWVPRYVETGRNGDVAVLRDQSRPARRRRARVSSLLDGSKWSRIGPC